MSQTNHEEILKQAKKIMDEFIIALDKVKVSDKFGVVRDAQVRVAEKDCEDSSEFRKRIFKNAPKIKDDYFQMEKKQW